MPLDNYNNTYDTGNTQKTDPMTGVNNSRAHLQPLNFANDNMIKIGDMVQRH